MLSAIREKSPLIHCITNTVTQNMVANVLLSVGGSPAMVDLEVEARQFAGVVDALLVNLGTPIGEQVGASLAAAEVAHGLGTPWVLDPVAVGFLAVRTALAQQLLAFRPSVIRGNASEILALARFASSGRGVDSSDAASDALNAGRQLALDHGSVVAISGPIDLITDGQRTFEVHNGHAFLTQVTGGGCALGGVLAAGSSVSQDLALDVTRLCAGYALAAERAARVARGPSSFQVSFIDELFSLSDADIDAEGKINVL